MAWEEDGAGVVVRGTCVGVMVGVGRSVDRIGTGVPVLGNTQPVKRSISASKALVMRLCLNFIGVSRLLSPQRAEVHAVNPYVPPIYSI
jgi:hypothetical protein